MKTSPQAAQRVAHTYPLTSLRSCAVGGSGQSSLQAWPQPHGLGIGARGLLAAYVTPRTPRRKGRAPVGGQTGKGRGAAIAFLNRVGVACAGRVLTRGNRGWCEGVTLCFPKAKPYFATSRNPRVWLIFPRNRGSFPRVVFCSAPPFSFFSSYYVEREKGRERGNDRQKSIHGLTGVFHGFKKPVTEAIHGLHRPSPCFPWIPGDAVPLQINDLCVAERESTYPREEMPLPPLRGFFFARCC